jgi:hypothetical protein
MNILTLIFALTFSFSILNFNSNFIEVSVQQNNRVELDSFINDPKSILSFKNNTPDSTYMNSNPCSCKKYITAKANEYKCYRFYYAPIDWKYEFTRGKPIGDNYLEIFTARKIKGNKNVDDYYDKSEILIGFKFYNNNKNFKNLSYIGKSTVLVTEKYGEPDHKTEKYFSYSINNKTLYFYHKNNKVGLIEYKSIQL